MSRERIGLRHASFFRPTKLGDNERVIGMQLVAAGAITEDHGVLAPSDELARAFEPGQLFALDW